LSLSTLSASANADVLKIPITAVKCFLYGISPGKSDWLLLHSLHDQTSCICLSKGKPFSICTAATHARTCLYRRAIG
jgi:hypothetical protein